MAPYQAEVQSARGNPGRTTTAPTLDDVDFDPLRVDG